MIRNMKVVHVAQCVAGGVGAYLDEVAAYQSRAFGKENVFFIVPEGGQSHLPSVDSSQLITFSWRGRNPVDLLAFGLGTVRTIRRLDPTIVHLHSSFAGGIIRPLLAGSRRPKVVYCPHGWAFGIETSNLKKFVYAEYERLLGSGTDLVIMNSDSERQLARQYRVHARRMKTIKNGIGIVPAPDPLDRQRRCARGGPLAAAFIGRFDRQKGLDILLDAMRELPETTLHLHVIGRGVRDQAESFREQVGSNVTFHGWLPRTEIMALLREIDLVVVPSRWEAHPLVAIEAMRSGVPVIASDRGGLPEIVRHGVDGYIFDIDDPTALATLLTGLDRTKLHEMGTQARARFEAELTSDRMNAHLEDAYLSLLSSRRKELQPETAEFGAAGGKGAVRHVS